MKSVIAALTAGERKSVFQDIYYLNMAELRRFCDAHAIPYKVHSETEDGRIVPTRDTDRKGIVIDRVLHFLSHGTIKPRTVFRSKVIARDRPEGLSAESDRVLYGRYKNHDPSLLKLMKRLTKGKFEFGAIAQEVLRACWAQDEAPTYREFAILWEKAAEKHTRPNREWAFLSDLANASAGPDWKKPRARKASAVIAILNKIG